MLITVMVVNLLIVSDEYDGCGGGVLAIMVTVVMVVIIIELTNPVAPESEGSSPHSQQPANDPYPESAESTPHPPNNLPKVHFDTILPSTPWSFKWSFSFGLSHQNPVHVSPLCHACPLK
jgi:hypothetical protein